MHEPFLSYRKHRWLKLSLLLVIASIAAYAIHNPMYGPSGGTWLGYTLGSIAAFLVVWLAWLGVRKRQLRSRMGTIKGWVSAHVWLGLSLIVIAALHCAFQFGWNVHTLAYALLIAVITSGIYGVIAYAHYPTLISRNRPNLSRDALFAEISALNNQALERADAISPKAHSAMIAHLERSRIGGSGWQQLRGGAERREQQQLDRLTQKLVDAAATTDAAALRDLTETLGRRHVMICCLARDIRHRARMQVWLYLHVPLSVGLLAALGVHIVSVFLYW